MRALVFVLVTAVTGCASAVSRGAPASRDLITAEDIARSNAQNAYEAVSRLQPHWLGSRGPVSMTDPSPTEVTVHVNGVETGGAEYLRTLDVTSIAEIRYYAPGAAGVRFGMGHPRGVIDVRLKGG